MMSCAPQDASVAGSPRPSTPQQAPAAVFGWSPSDATSKVGDAAGVGREGRSNLRLPPSLCSHRASMSARRDAACKSEACAPESPAATPRDDVESKKRPPSPFSLRPAAEAARRTASKASPRCSPRPSSPLSTRPSTRPSTPAQPNEAASHSCFARAGPSNASPSGAHQYARPPSTPTPSEQPTERARPATDRVAWRTPAASPAPSRAGTPQRRNSPFILRQAAQTAYRLLSRSPSPEIVEERSPKHRPPMQQMPPHSASKPPQTPPIPPRRSSSYSALRRNGGEFSATKSQQHVQQPSATAQASSFFGAAFRTASRENTPRRFFAFRPQQDPESQQDEQKERAEKQQQEQRQPEQHSKYHSCSPRQSSSCASSSASSNQTADSAKSAGEARTPPQKPRQSSRPPPPRTNIEADRKLTRRSALSVLGLDGTTSSEDLRKAYKKSALQWHPDRPHNHECTDEAKQRFQQVQEAFELLRDRKSSVAVAGG
eukprot:TRINITY_DN57781_c0_g1_i1.p1 TRINITY_DN57781_c0_g1~~TRINITY_DN57781_c0_g1_i1.p1  ORF type:complete len:488 (+),score=63.31 TRINITY_DN57781_c0_g1_i1:54-1517(+)